MSAIITVLCVSHSLSIRWVNRANMRLGGDRNGQMTQTNQRGAFVPHNVMLSNKKGNEEDLRRLAIFCLALGRVSIHCLEGTVAFVWIVLFCFLFWSTFLFHCSFVYETIFFLTNELPFLFSSLVPLVVEGRRKGWAAFVVLYCLSQLTQWAWFVHGMNKNIIFVSNFFSGC